MSGPDDDSAEKSHEATPEKLRKAREKGEIARSTDLSVAAGYAGLVLVFMTVGAETVRSLGSGLLVLLDQSDRMAELMFSGTIQAPFGGVLWQAVTSLIPWFALPALAVLLSIIAQRGLVFAPTKIQPKTFTAFNP